MSRRTPPALAAGLAAAALLGAGDARAWVRTTTDLGTPVYWAGNCVYMTPDSAASTDLQLPQVVEVLNRSVQNWQSVTLNKCAFLAIFVNEPDAVEAHLDRKNVLKFRTDTWCRPSENNTPEMCYPHSAAAITSVFFNSDPGKSDDGQIVDADIEVNNIDFTFVVEPTRTPPRPNTMIADLENTLTHEFGHFQGLDHTCWDHVKANAPIGDDGKAVPDCADVIGHRVADEVYRRITQATMFNFANPGEVIKRSPEDDDIDGICSIYPIASDPGECSPPDVKKGCSVAVGGAAGGAGTLAIALLALALFVLALRFRKRPSA